MSCKRGEGCSYKKRGYLVPYSRERACCCLKDVYTYRKHFKKCIIKSKQGELDQIITAGSVFQSFYFNLLVGFQNKTNKKRVQCIVETYIKCLEGEQKRKKTQ